MLAYRKKKTESADTMSPASKMTSPLTLLRLAIGFLTIIPIRADSQSAASPDARDLACSVRAFPAVGLLLGGVLVSLYWPLGRLLPAALTAVLLVAVHALVSGGLHLDGLADTFDALGSRGNAARKLVVMRDSRIGAHGAVALTLLLVGKVLLVMHLVDQQAASRALFLMPLLPRFGVVVLIVLFPYARRSGLGSPFAGAGLAELAAAAGVSAILFLPFSNVGAWAGASAALAVQLAFARLLSRKLGGLTGDVYGASVELGELSFIAAYAAFC
jgi:adenosylcobinamide-GDP ribazoletransferase